MNLFASFILRAAAIFIKDALLERPNFNPTTDLEMELIVKNEVRTCLFLSSSIDISFVMQDDAEFTNVREHSLNI